MSAYSVKGFDFRDGAPVSEIISADSMEEAKALYLNDGIAVTEIKELPSYKTPPGFGNVIGFGMTDNIFIP